MGADSESTEGVAGDPGSGFLVDTADSTIYSLRFVEIWTLNHGILYK